MKPSRSPLVALLASFGYAFAGIAHAARTQRNFRIHIVITSLVILLGTWLRLSAERWAILVLTIGVVFQAELVNTALEAIVDKVSPEFHPLAKIAKDCVAGAVLVLAVAAVIVGGLVMGPRLIERLGDF